MLPYLLYHFFAISRYRLSMGKQNCFSNHRKLLYRPINIFGCIFPSYTLVSHLIAPFFTLYLGKAYYLYYTIKCTKFQVFFIYIAHIRSLSPLFLYFLVIILFTNLTSYLFFARNLYAYSHRNNQPILGYDFKHLNYALLLCSCYTQSLFSPITLYP